MAVQAPCAPQARIGVPRKSQAVCFCILQGLGCPPQLKVQDVGVSLCGTVDPLSKCCQRWWEWYVTFLLAAGISSIPFSIF